MPEKQTIERAERDKEQGKSPSTPAGEFVREEFHHVREGKHGARSPQQAIAIGLSKARRAGVKLGAPKAGRLANSLRKQAERDLARGGWQTERIAQTFSGDAKRFAERKQIERFKVRAFAADERSCQEARGFFLAQCRDESGPYQGQRRIAPGWTESCAYPATACAIAKSVRAAHLFCVVVDDAKRVSYASSHRADSVPQCQPEKTPSAFPGPMASSEHNSVALISGNYLSARLRSRNIFYQHELPAIPISSLLTKHHDQLQRKCDFAIDILVQAVIASCLVVERQRRG
jgi:hypothetical protein